MYDHFEGYLNAGCFQPRDGHHFTEITVVEHGDTFNAELSEGLLAENTISGWLHEKEAKIQASMKAGDFQRTSTFRLLISAPRLDPGITVEPFPMSPATYHDIVRVLHIPERFLDFALSHTHISTEFQIGGYSGMMTTLGSHGIALSYDPQRSITNCFIIGLCEHQISRHKRELWDLQNFAHDPMLCASIWLDIFVETRVRRAEGRKIALAEIKLKSGMHWSVDATQFEPTTLDFGMLTHKLTILQSELAWDEFALKTLRNFQAKVAGLCKQHDGVQRAASDLDKRLANTNDILHSLQEATSFTIAQASSQLQMIYSLISQRDNRHNMEQAQASRRLAELGLYDSSAMRSIAVDSNKMAVMARRDSNDMRIIAAVTLAFLPGTFTATLFSASFWDFSPTNDSNIVSHWVWLYWAVTVGLTVAVMVVWYEFSRRSNRKLHVSLNQTLPVTADIPLSPDIDGILKNAIPLGQIPLPAGVDTTPPQPQTDESFFGPTFATSSGKRFAHASAASVPASKVTPIGIRNYKATCLCCARPMNET